MLSRAFSHMPGRRGSCIHRRMSVDATQIMIPLITGLISGGFPVAAVIIYLKQFKELMTKDNVHLQEVLGNRITSVQESSASTAKDIKGSLELLDSRLGSRMTSIQESTAKDIKNLTESLNNLANTNLGKINITDL